MSLDKSSILTQCIKKQEEILKDLHSAMAKVKESIEGEDKSSAGDKFETARAMAQKEMEILGVQIRKASNDLGILQQIKAESTSEHIQLGSVVETESKTLFIAVAMGKITIDKKDVFVVSPASPIGQLLIGKSAGDSYQIADKIERIKGVY